MRPLLLLAMAPAIGLATPFSYTTGKVRIQILSSHLVRMEQQGPLGFEDRKTFTVINRDLGKVKVTIEKLKDRVVLKAPYFSVAVLNDATSLMQAAIFDGMGRSLYHNEGKIPSNGYLPAPGAETDSWVLSDSPRLVPPVWGATPAPKNGDPALASTSGWDTRNDAPDIYVFLPGEGGYAQLRKDFLDLTGPVPKPPLFALGFIDSRWFPYTEKQALESIDIYRAKGIPLDTFVVDTDWRINGSAGYEVETKDFPDMPRFIKEAHDRHAHLMFNDHPDPKAATATDPKELAFRWKGLTKLLDWGMDIWWYDRNWSTSLKEPMPGIHKEMWGQRLYHDITERARPSQRPWIMANAEGIDNGLSHYAPEPAGHRYPMMWTGDTGSQFAYLKRGVENGVDRGVLALQPYTHEDLGGHTGPTPSPELYVRYLEYGCLSPITRVHCTLGQDRHPWAFGPEAEKIVTDYIKLRYRLLPTLYSAAQRTCDDGTPMLRRCDLLWPNLPDAARNDQYLLGDNILVAPIVSSVYGDLKPIPAEMLQTPNGRPGLRAEYYDNANLTGSPQFVRNDSQIDFDWSGHKPVDNVPQDNFSVRWTGTLGPVPTSGKYRLVTRNDDGVRLYVDGKLVIDDWKPEDSATQQADLTFTAGSTHTIRMEYMQLTGDALCTLGWYLPSKSENQLSQRTAWIPPGTWIDLWTGRAVQGPQTVTVTAALSQIPMWVSAGGIVLTGQDIQYTSQKPMDHITADVYVGGRVINKIELAEDDGISNAYLKGQVARTEVSLIADETQATVWLGATKGTYAGMQPNRTWSLRVHLRAGTVPDKVTVDGESVRYVREGHRPVEMPFLSGAAPDEGDVITLTLHTTSNRLEHVVKLTMKGA